MSGILTGGGGWSPENGSYVAAASLTPVSATRSAPLGGRALVHGFRPSTAIPLPVINGLAAQRGRHERSRAMAEQRKDRAPARREQDGNSAPAQQETGQPGGPDLSPFMAKVDPSQATTVEWVRAAAEVRAAVMVAREFPRDMAEAERELRRSCGQIAMARHAFYTYTRGGNTITGPTVQLAREAMRCFGNFQAGMWELQRRPGWSEMMVWAWDLQTNARFASTFRVNHVVERAAEKGGPRYLDEFEIRDIYELNTNMAARRLREQIKAGLPVWFMGIAEDACKATMLGGAPLPESIENCVRVFRREFGVPEEALVRKIGAPRAAWSKNDLLTLRVLAEALAEGELRRDNEFPELARPSGSAADTLAKAQQEKGGQ